MGRHAARTGAAPNSWSDGLRRPDCLDCWPRGEARSAIEGTALCEPFPLRCLDEQYISGPSAEMCDGTQCPVHVRKLAATGGDHAIALASRRSAATAGDERSQNGSTWEDHRGAELMNIRRLASATSAGC